MRGLCEYPWYQASTPPQVTDITCHDFRRMLTSAFSRILATFALTHPYTEIALTRLTASTGASYSLGNERHASEPKEQPAPTTLSEDLRAF